MTLSAISQVGDFCVLRLLPLYLSVRLLSQRVQHASAYPGGSVSDNKFQLLYSLLVSPHTNKSTKKRSEVSLHNIAQLVAQLSSTSSLPVTLHNHSSTGNHTIVYFKHAQLSLRKGHNYADSQSDSQARSQACRCLGRQKRGVSKIGEASPSGSGTNQNNFYLVLIVFRLFYHDPNNTW